MLNTVKTSFPKLVLMSNSNRYLNPCYSSRSKSATGSSKSGCGDKNDKDGAEDRKPETKPDSNKYPSMYDYRKYGHELPGCNVTPCFEPLHSMPTGIFRETCGEQLGNGAYKGGCYQNPEYFSFHHMTFFDMHMLMRAYRLPSPETGRKP